MHSIRCGLIAKPYQQLSKNNFTDYFMSIFSNPEFDNHEGVYSFADPSCLMRCFIAVHSTKMGPASGGTRFWTYVSDEEAPVTYSKPLDLARPSCGTVVPTVDCCVPLTAVAVSKRFTVLNASTAPETNPTSGVL